MKNGIKFLLLFLVSVLFFPISINAEEKNYINDYDTKNLIETLKAEEIELINKDYVETNDQMTIYLFRGQGCGYCRAFLTFLNSISEEYGKYFKLVSYEVWNDADNAELMQDISTFMKKQAGGVPYIIIGNKVFAGYSETYDEQIKDAILAEYEKSTSDRYDLFKEYEKSLNGETTVTNQNGVSNTALLIWNLISISTATIIVILFHNTKNKKLEEEINDLKSIIKKTQKEK